MVVICSMDVLIKDGKLGNDAKTFISAMGKQDRLIIVSKTGNITVNTETLNFLTHINCPIEVSEYANEAAMLLNVGMELAKATQLRIVMKAEDAATLKDLLKGNEKVSFGWSDTKTRKKAAVEKKAEEKPAVPIEKPAKKVTAPKKAEKEAPAQEVKESRKRTKKKADAVVPQEKGNVTLEEVKAAIGEKYSKKDLEAITAVINEASDAELGLDFLLKIKVPILYQKDETLTERVKKAYQTLRG